MSGFTATAPIPSTSAIKAGNWWPDIDPDEARKIMRVDGVVTSERITECLSIAIAAVQDELDAWQRQQEQLGRSSLDKVPSKVIGDTTRLVLLYRRAVYAYAQAELIERYREFDTTARGDRRADVLYESVDDYRRNVRYAIRDILGRPRATVDLI